MRICSQYVGLRKVYEMTEFQSFKISKFERVAPNSVSGLVFYIVSFFFVLIFVLGIPDVILAQETSEDDGLEDVLSGFDAEGSDEDEALSGFDEGSPELRFGEMDSDGERESGVDDEIWSNLSGSAGLSASYSYAKDAPADKTQADWSGLTKLRPYFSLTWDAKLGENWKTRISGKAFYDFAYGMKDSETFSDEVLSELEKEAELREIYLEGSPFGNLDIKLRKADCVLGCRKQFACSGCAESHRQPRIRDDGSGRRPTADCHDKT